MLGREAIVQHKSVASVVPMEIVVEDVNEKVQTIDPLFVAVAELSETELPLV